MTEEYLSRLVVKSGGDDVQRIDHNRNNKPREDGSAHVGLPGLSLEAGVGCQSFVNVAAVKLVKLALK